MLGRKRFKPKLFYHVSLDRLVAEDDFYRKLNELLDLSYLYQLCSPFYGTTGNPSIDPVVFFKIKFVGYLENITSNRKLAKRVADSLAIRLFLGFDLDETTPHHSTISDTERLLPAEIHQRVFDQILALAVASGLVSGDHISIDSTLVKANASLDNIERRSPELSASALPVAALIAESATDTSVTARGSLRCS